MKHVLKSAATVVALGGFVMAGGDIAPVESVVDAPMVSASTSSFYAGLALSATSTREAAVSMDIFSEKNGQDRLGNFTFQAGYEFNPYIAVEGRYTTSFSYEDYVEMDGWSLFVKPQYPITEELSIYALIGYGGVALDGVSTATIDIDDNGFQWGLGVSYDMMNNFTVFFDYTSLANDMDGTYRTDDQADADALTLGVTYRF
jgi:opacity protein-like surface antigen